MHACLGIYSKEDIRAFNLTLTFPASDALGVQQDERTEQRHSRCEKQKHCHISIYRSHSDVTDHSDGQHERCQESEYRALQTSGDNPGISPLRHGGFRCGFFGMAIDSVNHVPFVCFMIHIKFPFRSALTLQLLEPLASSAPRE